MINRSDGRVFRADQQQSAITQDYGFIIIAPNPYDKKRTVRIVFGIWPLGTTAALETLIHPDSSDELGQQFIKKALTPKGV